MNAAESYVIINLTALEQVNHHIELLLRIIMTYQVHHKEKKYLIIMGIISIAMWCAFLYFSKYNFLLSFFYLFLIFTLQIVGTFFLRGHLKGNAIKIHEKQFPEIFAILKEYSKALSIPQIPEVYLLQGNGVLNAFAARLARKNFVVLHSDVLEAAYDEGIDAIAFVIGHELGHIKRNHVGFLKHLLLFPAQLIPFLGSAYSRACEYTCDNIGYSLCPQGASQGLLMLACGKKLYKKVDLGILLESFTHESDFSISFAEFFLTHPVLMRRLSNIDQLNQHNIASEKPLFISPKIDTSKEIQK